MGQDQSCSSPKLWKGIKETRGERKREQNSFTLHSHFAAFSWHPVSREPESDARSEPPHQLHYRPTPTWKVSGSGRRRNKHKSCRELGGILFHCVNYRRIRRQLEQRDFLKNVIFRQTRENFIIFNITSRLSPLARDALNYPGKKKKKNTSMKTLQIFDASEGIITARGGRRGSQEAF